MAMKNPPHPGKNVLRTCIKPLGLSITAAAHHLGVSRVHLSKLVNERSGISPDMAMRLSKVFGSTTEHWLRLQMAYDLAQVEKRAASIKVRPVKKKRLVPA